MVTLLFLSLFLFPSSTQGRFVENKFTAPHSKKKEQEKKTSFKINFKFVCLFFFCFFFWGGGGINEILVFFIL